MTAEEMWKASGCSGEYEAWAFGDDPDVLAGLVLAGRKTATASAYPLYALENEPIPRAGEHSVILDSRGEAVCVIRTSHVYVVPFGQVSAEHARREGEGDGTLTFWREAHRDFFAREMAEEGLAFDAEMPVVCEEFELVYPKEEA